MIKIRNTTINDLDVLTNFWLEEEKLHEKYANIKLRKDAKNRMGNFLKKKIKNRNFKALIAEENNIAIGCIHGWVENSYFTYKPYKIGHAGTIFVKKEFRGKGIGKLLMKELIKWFKKNNIKKVSLCVHTKNKKAIKLYERLGFQVNIEIMNKNI